ncbi:MAG: LAGLIDADG family homing endonuclease, partial [Candidatus Aminicenantia bacterium]
KYGALRKYLKEVIRSRKRDLDEDLVVKSYLQGSSLSKLRRENRSSHYTIRKILIKNGIKIRNLEEAKDLALPRYLKNSFNGNQIEKAYVIGMCLGDLYVRRASKNVIRISTSSTKENFVKLLTNLFQKYGRIRRYKYGNAFKFVADVNNSFGFLLNAKKSKASVKEFSNDKFLSFLAGFIDAEGSLIIVRDRKWWKFCLRIYNTDYSLLKIIKKRLENMDIKCKLELRWTKGTERMKNGEKIISTKNGYMIEITNKKDILNLLKNLNLQHEEKILRKVFILDNLSNSINP